MTSWETRLLSISRIESFTRLLRSPSKFNCKTHQVKVQVPKVPNRAMPISRDCNCVQLKSSLKFLRRCWAKPRLTERHRWVTTLDRPGRILCFQGQMLMSFSRIIEEDTFQLTKVNSMMILLITLSSTQKLLSTRSWLTTPISLLEINIKLLNSTTWGLQKVTQTRTLALPQLWVTLREAALRFLLALLSRKSNSHQF